MKVESMRNFIFLVSVLFFALHSMGQESSRNSVKLKTDDCWAITGTVGAPDLKDIGQQLGENHSGKAAYKCNPYNEFIHSKDTLTGADGLWLLYRVAVLNNRYSSIGLFNPLQNDDCIVYVNGDTVADAVGGQGFFADIAPNVVSDSVTIAVDLKKWQSVGQLNKLADSFTFEYLSGIGVTSLQILKNQLFGSYSVEIHVANFFDKDVDGKLYARVFDKDTYQQLDENTNCAFTSADSEVVIEVSFIDEQSKLKTGSYVLEVMLVDKARNEEVIDQVSREVFFP
jgi:hypothetical protein